MPEHSNIEDTLYLEAPTEEVTQSGARYSREDEAKFVARMKAGDDEARDLFIECLQPYVRSLARKYAAAYSWASSFIDYDNILSELNYMIMVLLVEKCAMGMANPSGYVRTCIARKISQYCWRYARPITVPQKDDWNEAAAAITAIISLDEPLYDDADFTLADQVADPGTTKTAMTTEDDYRNLYDAIDHALTPNQRYIVNSVYGLCQTPEGSAYQGQTLRTAHEKLRVALLPPVPPEVVYARELEVWNAGNRSIAAFSMAMGLTKGKAITRMGKMQEAGLIQCRTYAVNRSKVVGMEVAQ